jgi:hypothetical protein
LKILIGGDGRIFNDYAIDRFCHQFLQTTTHSQYHHQQQQQQQQEHSLAVASRGLLSLSHAQSLLYQPSNHYNCIVSLSHGYIPLNNNNNHNNNDSFSEIPFSNSKKNIINYGGFQGEFSVTIFYSSSSSSSSTTSSEEENQLINSIQSFTKKDWDIILTSLQNQSSVPFPISILSTTYSVPTLDNLFQSLSQSIVVEIPRNVFREIYADYVIESSSYQGNNNNFKKKIIGDSGRSRRSSSSSSSSSSLISIGRGIKQNYFDSLFQKKSVYQIANLSLQELNKSLKAFYTLLRQPNLLSTSRPPLVIIDVNGGIAGYYLSYIFKQLSLVDQQDPFPWNQLIQMIHDRHNSNSNNNNNIKTSTPLYTNRPMTIELFTEQDQYSLTSAVGEEQKKSIESIESSLSPHITEQDLSEEMTDIFFPATFEQLEVIKQKEEDTIQLPSIMQQKPIIGFVISPDNGFCQVKKKSKRLYCL